MGRHWVSPGALVFAFGVFWFWLVHPSMIGMLIMGMGAVMLQSIHIFVKD